MRWWERLRRRSVIERQLDAELRDHLDRQASELMDAGVPEAEARRRARLTFGGLDQIKEACRDVRGTRGIEILLQDVRYAWRGLVAQPAFTMVVVLSLALGIGANTTAYTLIHAALLRALPVPDPDRLVELTVYDAEGDRSNNFGYPLYEELREALQPYAVTAALYSQRLNRVSIDGQGVERAVVEVVSANYFGMLQLGAADGRLLVDADDAVAGDVAAAVVSSAYRDRRFGVEAPVIGQTIAIEEKPYTIVGVVARGFDGVEAQARTDIWLPLRASLPERWLTSNGSMIFRYMARLQPGIDATQATAVVDLVYQRFLEGDVLPKLKDAAARAPYASRHLRLRPAPEGLSSLGHEYRRPLLILMGSVAIILLLCCANVANLMLARQRSREQEFAVRLSLGAGPGRLARQLLTESLFLGSIGTLLGLAVAYWSTPLLLQLLPDRRIPIALDVSPDARVFAFTAFVGLLSAIAVGLGPAWRAAKTDAGLSLSHNSRTVLRPRMGRVLVIAQLSGSLVLLVTALLMAQTLRNLRSADLGFHPEQLLAFELSMPATYPKPTKADLYDRILNKLSGSSGIDGVTYSRESVYSPGGWAGSARMPGQSGKPDRQVCLMRVGPGFFDTVGIKRASGRVFEPDDHRAARRVIVINETMARYFFGQESPSGRTLYMSAEQDADYEVVGVVKDVRHYGIRERACGGRAAYVPADAATPAGTFMVRGTIPLGDVQRIVRDELREVGGVVLLERLRPLEADVANLVARERMVGTLAIGFALLALAIAAVGLYGVMAYGVSQRTNEIGLRAALGAAPGTLTRMVLRDALLLVAAGVALGLPASVASVRILGSLLFGVAATDPTTIALAALVLAAIAGLAAWLPARRAAAIDPATALRNA
jgi:predicted permease